MATFNVPEKGIVVQHDSRTASPDQQPLQVIQLDLVDNLTKDILRSLKTNEPVRLRCGKKPVVQFGKKSIPLASTTATFPSEIYSNPPHNHNTLYFSGKLSHTLEVRKAEEDTAGSDEALAALESTLKSIQEQRASNETSIIGSKDGRKGNRDHKVSPLISQNASLRKDFDHLMPRSTPSSPFLSANYSPRLGPTSAGLGTGISTKDQVRLDAIKIPLIHLLAIRPLTSRGVAEKLRAPRDEVEKILEKVARDTQVGDGRKELKEKTYRELNVHKFNYRTPEDRQSAIANAITAYDRIRVDKKDPLWQLLLPENERGKGKCLSKLNFDKPTQVPSHAATRPGDDSNESKADVSDREPGKVKAKKGIVTTHRKPKDKPTTARPSAKADANVPPRPKDMSSKQTKPDGKFKSSERIEDSDEEANAAEALVAKPKARPAATGKASAVPNAKRKPGQEQSKPSTPSHIISPPKKTVHKTSLSGSSSGSGSGNERPRINPNSETSKSLQPQSRPDPSITSNSRISPRPRHNSSPQKPSPLGSSPPTTSTDVENSSSSKASNQSSAPSSPPSGTDMPQVEQQNNKYSPVISSDKAGNQSRGRSPVRRKADMAEDARPTKRKAETAPNDDRPAKRTQHEKTLINGTTPNASTKPQRVAPRRQNSDSHSSRCSSPEKPGPKREDVILDARRFQKYYKRYKDLYDRIASVSETERDDKDMDDLWKMHKRLKEMKADIWGNWDKVEKISKVNDKIDKPMRQAVAAA
ncbi:uncharacterized protein A1O9_07070 [Exophiala aquamarina CBS 119918]|uniref:Uncharacterized protein n=1 Tax=Exophiala aquamarina CBS 119918 TaxID=1182545 RepID=A0A072PMY5_9EURO|nr:uncharacterized protein A1O9_07070 [Exophiala aquamarina CBS 119918]KEF56880.1 hypothetical protein A1O9_07070 [Exophiala aquamarina CBS 119918]